MTVSNEIIGVEYLWNHVAVSNEIIGVAASWKQKASLNESHFITNFMCFTDMKLTKEM